MENELNDVLNDLGWMVVQHCSRGTIDGDCYFSNFLGANAAAMRRLVKHGWAELVEGHDDVGGRGITIRLIKALR